MRRKPEKPEVRRRRNFLQRYGMTPEQVEVKLINQGHRCELCGQPLALKDAHVDHHHETGAIRGLLHGTCNRNLAHVENREFREAALRYLDKYPRLD